MCFAIRWVLAFALGGQGLCWCFAAAESTDWATVLVLVGSLVIALLPLRLLLVPAPMPSTADSALCACGRVAFLLGYTEPEFGF